MGFPAKILSCLFAASVASLSASADLAIKSAMRHASPELGSVRVLQRMAVGDDLDLVTAFGSPAAYPAQESRRVWWDNRTAIGIFLQSQTRSDLVFKIAVEKGVGDGECHATIERMTATETIVSCTPEKGWDRSHRKFIYDVRAKALVSRIDYDRYKMRQIKTYKDRVIVFGGNSARSVAVEYVPSKSPAFRLVDAKQPPHPSERPFADPPKEEIGPRQTVEGKMWFGNRFYDGEGYTGTGSFGYIDRLTGKKHLYKPPEIARWSTSAILVEPDAVWLGLVHHGEWGDASGGLLRFDRATEKVERIPLPDIATQVVRVEDGLVLATDFGIAIVKNGEMQRYFVDETSDGRLRVVEASLAGAN